VDASLVVYFGVPRARAADVAITAAARAIFSAVNGGESLISSLKRVGFCAARLRLFRWGWGALCGQVYLVGQVQHRIDETHRVSVLDASGCGAVRQPPRY